MSAMLYARSHMLDCPEIPEIKCHGTRRIEIRADGLVCVWQCEDYMVEGASTYCLPRVKLVLPVQTFIANTQAIAQWAFDRGLVRIPLAGSGALIWPQGTRH